MQVKDITNYLEDLFPLGSQASYDNSGLIIGQHYLEVSGTLICLDCTEAVIDEALSLGANLIISHHPLVFSGLKKLNGKTYVERTVIKAIQHNIAIYAIHTNLDHGIHGVNAEIARRLGIHSPRVLAPSKDTLSKLVVYVPKSHLEELETALFEAGAGRIGNYDECRFVSEGEGSFKAGNGANPFLGKIGKRELVEENKLEVLVSQHKLGAILSAMQNVHPYEEIAYDVHNIQNTNPVEGAGMIGELVEEMETLTFLKHLKTNFKCGSIRHTNIHKKKIKRIAFCGGSGSFLLQQALTQGADLYITGDFKYHEFFDADERIIIADIGHFESEQFTSDLLMRILSEKFINFALHLSRINTNPINYF